MIKKFFVGCWLSMAMAAAAWSQVIPVEPPTKGLFRTQQTMTMLHERSDAELTIVVVMGHPGHFGLQMGDVYVKNQTARLMRGLMYRDKIKAHVVVLDNPYPMHGVGARSSNDHLSRIESVVNYSSQKFKLPIWLFGHSDGSISVSEFLNRSEDARQSLSGAILSAGRDDARIQADWKVATLILHHEKDGCQVTTYGGAQRLFARIRETNTGPAELATVVGGYSSGPPCSSGFHMYEGAADEALGLMENFIACNR